MMSETMDASLDLPAPGTSTAPIPLVVDVDGTLIKTDLLHESTMQLIAQGPQSMVLLPYWLASGKANLKARLAERVELDMATVPLRQSVVDLIETAKAAGRPVYLASASATCYVAALAERIGATGYFASTPERNLAGGEKASVLVEAFGETGFDYVGDHRVDIPVWAVARQTIAVSRSRTFTASLRRQFPDVVEIPGTHVPVKACLKALRVHQWLKNALVFLPLLAGHHFTVDAIASAVIAFLCFSFAASSAYALNDLLDLPGDRDHPRKQHRPFASGTMSITFGLMLSATLILTAFGMAAATLPIEFLAVLGLYFVTTMAYSLVLKRQTFIDVIVLGALYTVRVIAGVAAIGATRSPWLLMFCLFLFLSLAIVKRCSELIARQVEGKSPPRGRGYDYVDLRMLQPLAAAAGYGSIFVIALYLQSPDVQALYAHPERMWLSIPPLVYWISRVLMVSNRNAMHDDPVVFAVTDKASWACGACVLASILVSI
jgi:4-hydroxybenzoate polyprenyltransferase/phosphoserine phosphatase